MKWTILFIIHGLDDGLQEQSQVLINVIRYGNWSLKYTNLLYLKSETDFSKKGRPVNAVLNKVSSLSDKRRGKPVTTREKVFPKINIGSKAKLEKVFEYVRKEYPAEKLMLLVFDHGAGFGIFEAIPTTEKRLPFSNLEDVDDVLYNSKQNQTYQRFIPKASSGFYPGFRHRKKFKLSHGPSRSSNDGLLKFFRKTYAKTDMLTMEELSESIKRGFGRKVDVVVLINCNMQMIETGYSLKDNVDYLVASETLFWIYGINYRELLFRIDSHPSISPRKVATVCVETMPFRYERIGKLKSLNDVSFSAIELKTMIPVYDKLDEFVSSLLPDVKDHFKTIATARQKGVDLSQFSFTKKQKEDLEPLFFYDLLHFLKSMGPGNELVKKIEYLIAKAIVAKFIGSDFGKGNKRIVNGISIYFPFLRNDFEMQYFDLFYERNAKFKVDFSNTNWGEFIKRVEKIRG